MTEPPPPPPTHRVPAIKFIFFALLLEVLGFGLIIPVGPKLVQHLMGDVTEAQAAPAFAWLSATYAIVSLIFAPTLGALSDRFGRRPVLLVAILGSGLDYFAMAAAPNLWWLFITRAINGLSGGTMTVASAYIVDVTPPEKRAAGFGLLGAAFGIGFVLGPVLGGVLGSVNIHLPFIVAGALCVVNWLYGCFVLPESLDPARRSHLTLAKMNPVSALIGAMEYPVMRRMAWVWLFLSTANFALHATWAYTMYARYQWKEWQVGLSLAIVGVGAAVVQAGLAKRVIKRFGERRTIFFGLGVAVLAFLGYAWAPAGWVIYVVVAIASLGGVAGPALQAFVTKRVRPDQQGLVQGALSSIQNLAQIAGYLAGGWAFAHFAKAGADPLIPGAAFYLSAFLAGIGLLFSTWATAIRHADGVCGECRHLMPDHHPDTCPNCKQPYAAAGIRAADDTWKQPPAGVGGTEPAA